LVLVFLVAGFKNTELNFSSSVGWLKNQISQFSKIAIQKGVQIIYDLPNNIEVFADEKMVETIIRNLLSTALKFTPKGGQIGVTFRYSDDNWIEISVSDNGIGISEVLISQLFNSDVKSNRKGTDGELSSGLGLIICNDFIAKHGGVLNVISTQDVGSTFSFRLPTQQLL
jgi:signal transduction histidine kinase